MTTMPPRKNVVLTKEQFVFITFVKQFSKDHGYCPSFHEIMDGLGYASTSSVSGMLERLQKRGAVKVIPNTKRGIRVLV